jgi:hypothetical protein
MLEAISWKEYLMGTGIVALGYYAVVISIYYKNDVRTLLSGRLPDQAEKKGKVDWSEEGLKDPMEELETVVSDIRSILEGAGKNVGKAEIQERTSRILQNYSGFREPAYRVAIRNFLIQHSEEICGLDFSDEELEAFWENMG